MKKRLTEALVIIATSTLVAGCAGSAAQKTDSSPEAAAGEAAPAQETQTAKNAEEPETPEQTGEGFGRLSAEQLEEKQKPAKPAGPTTELEVVAIDDNADKAVVEQALSKKLNALKYCYERQLQKAPGLAGDLKLELNISAEGTINMVTDLGGSLDDDKVKSCAERVIKRVRMPEPEGKTNANAHVELTFAQ